jgi:hypothetical protein
MLTSSRLYASRRPVHRGCGVHTNFTDESICLLASNFRKEVVTIHRSQEMLNVLSLTTAGRSHLQRQIVETNCKNEPC